MIKTCMLYFVFICTLSGCSHLSIGKISYLVGKKQDDKIGSLKQSTFYEVRKQLFDKYPSIFSGRIDTVYFMEKYEIEDASYYGIIWTKTDTVSYSLFANNIKLDTKKPFTDKAISLISTWDIITIRNEERKYTNSSIIVYVARANVAGNKYQIDTLKMKDLIFER